MSRHINATIAAQQCTHRPEVSPSVLRAKTFSQSLHRLFHNLEAITGTPARFQLAGADCGRETAGFLWRRLEKARLVYRHYCVLTSSGLLLHTDR